MRNMKKVLFDTDIGSDIDDAVCLAYLLAQPECELLGITTVSGQSVQRAKMASALCKVAGVDIPVFPGTEIPFEIEQRQPEAPQAAALDKWEHEATYPTGEAVKFLRSTIRANPGEVTLLAVGPFTNLGHLFKTDPEIGSLLGELVLMGGVFLSDDPVQKGVEWNVRCDPHAAAVVYEQHPPVHRSIGLDVTRQVTMPAAEVRERFQTTILRPVLDFAEVWFEKRREHITFHDPLAATTLFRNNICVFERGTVALDLQDESRLGVTDWVPGAQEAPHEVATQVDAEGFFTEYFDIVSR